MRMVFSVLGLLVVVAIVGVLAKKQLTSAPRVAGESSAGVIAPTGTPRQQVDQVKQSVDALMQHPRPSADDAK